MICVVVNVGACCVFERFNCVVYAFESCNSFVLCKNLSVQLSLHKSKFEVMKFATQSSRFVSISRDTTQNARCSDCSLALTCCRRASSDPLLLLRAQDLQLSARCWRSWREHTYHSWFRRPWAISNDLCCVLGDPLHPIQRFVALLDFLLFGNGRPPKAAPEERENV